MNFRFFLEKGNSLSLSLFLCLPRSFFSPAFLPSLPPLSPTVFPLISCVRRKFFRHVPPSAHPLLSSFFPLLLLLLLSLLSLSFSRRRGKPLRLSSQRKLVPSRGNREENFSPTFSLSLSLPSLSLFPRSLSRQKLLPSQEEAGGGKSSSLPSLSFSSLLS